MVKKILSHDGKQLSLPMLNPTYFLQLLASQNGILGLPYSLTGMSGSL